MSKQLFVLTDKLPLNTRLSSYLVGIFKIAANGLRLSLFDYFLNIYIDFNNEKLFSFIYFNNSDNYL